MIVVIDTNILLAALIKNSTVRKIIFNSEWKFFYPELSFHEVVKYTEVVLKKSGMTEEEYFKILSCILKNINLVSDDKIKEKLDEARTELEKVDPDDVIFLATALSIDKSKIWSDDNHLSKQKKIIVHKTKDIVSLFELEEKNKKYI